MGTHEAGGNRDWTDYHPASGTGNYGFADDVEWVGHVELPDNTGGEAIPAVPVTTEEAEAQAKAAEQPTDN